MTSEASPAIIRSNPPELGTPPGYSQIVEVRASRLIFISGQTALDAGGNLVGKNDFAAQAGQVFHNLAVALRQRGCDPSHLVKLTVFLTDMSNLAAYREARNRFLVRDAAGSPRRDADRGVQALRCRFPDRNRGDRRRVS